MRSIRIQDEQSPFYPDFLRTNTASFPDDERRGPAAQSTAFADPHYRLDAWLDGETFVGFMGWWDFGEYRYIEHIAVSPEARSGGYGGKILQAWMTRSSTPVYLEIEEVVDELTRRRLNFYLRHGLVETGLRHDQPPYQGDGNDVSLQVLSWPKAISPDEHARFLDTLHGVVWAGVGE